jgi:YegS/Rv2252/BmrU family lipid kinase
MPDTKMLKEPVIVLNPHAAKGRALSQRDTIAAWFSQAGIPVHIVLTQKPLDAIDLARDAVIAGHRTIIAAGGDGTMNEVVEGVVRASRALDLSDEETPVVGLIPIGRGNDFAWFADIPKDVGAACEVIASGAWSYIDYGELFGGRFPEGRCFVNGVGVGFEPMVNFIASDFTHVSGMLSYLLGFIKILIHYPQPVHMKIETENESFFCDTQQLSLCNGRRMGSTFIMGPYAELDDGLLDVVYANKPIAGKHILRYALRFFSGSQLKTDRFSLIRARRIAITSEQDDLVCHADGEEVSRGCRNITVNLHPGKLKLLRKM